MDEQRREAAYARVKSASGAYGALRREIEQKIETRRLEDAAALAEMILVRELDDWYTGEALPNVRAAIRAACARLREGALQADLMRPAALLAHCYASLHFDDMHSYELCRAVAEQDPGSLRSPADKDLVHQRVQEWTRFRESEPLADLLAQADRTELEDLANALRIDVRPPGIRELRELVESEMMYAGADSIASALRGRGVPYEEVARDVAGQMGVLYSDLENDSPAVIERRVLLKIVADMWDKMASAEREEFLREATAAGVKGMNVNMSGQAATFLLLLAGKLSGFFAYRLAVIVANAVARAVLGRGLALAANASLTRGVAIALGPVGWAVTAVTLVPMISGPAYRKTIPALAIVGALRARVRAGVAGGDADQADRKDSTGNTP